MSFATTSRRVRPRMQARRPIDKMLINIQHNSVSSSQVTTVLITAAFPCTVTGLRWDLSALQDAGVATSAGRWVILIHRDSATIDGLSTGNGTTLYKPEQDVLAFGSWLIKNASNNVTWSGSTKTMRKLKIGDRITFVMKGTDVQLVQLHGVVQLF